MILLPVSVIHLLTLHHPCDRLHTIPTPTLFGIIGASRFLALFIDRYDFQLSHLIFSKAIDYFPNRDTIISVPKINLTTSFQTL